MRNDWAGQDFPHPPGRKPVVGDGMSIDARRPLHSMVGHSRGLGEIFEVQVFDQKFVFVAGARLAAEMCDESRFAKALPPALTALREFAGDGLFTAHNDEANWSLAHDLLRPAFTRQAMQGYHPIMLDTLDELFAYWERQDGPVDVSRDMTKLTMETLARAAFSHDFGSFAGTEVHPFVPAMVHALTSGQRIASIETAPGSGLLKRRIRRRNAPYQAYVDELIDEVIAERRATGVVSDHDLLGIMLDTAHPDTGERLDDLNIRYQILTFLVAGHETTSGALSFALYYLSRDPEVLARAQAEVDTILGPDLAAVPEFDQVAKFRYLRRVVDEALRLWPTAPAFGRAPRDELTLSSGHRMRPEDWAIVLLPAVHRDPEIWGDDAEEFDPDRFLAANARGRLPHTYKPFGTGERSCIGRQFALHESILVLARLLHRYDIVGDPGYGLDITERLTIMPAGFELTLVPRTPSARAADAESADEPQASSEVCPFSSIDQNGLRATSQR